MYAHAWLRMNVYVYTLRPAVVDKATETTTILDLNLPLPTVYWEDIVNRLSACLLVIMINTHTYTHHIHKQTGLFIVRLGVSQIN